MNARPHIPTCRRVPTALMALSFVLGSSSLCAQTTPAAKPTDPAAGADEDLVVLSPFVVEASEDDGYLATDTLAGTRIRTSLADVGSAISVITAKFLTDTGARNSEDLLVLTTGTEVGSTRGSMSAITASDRDTNETAALTRVNTNTRVRGLGSADNTRDFFLTDIPWDAYNVGRVDLQRGPNSILYGLGQPAGIVNSSLNGASFKNAGKFETRFGSYGSKRGSVDYNQVLLKDELAIRIASLYDRTEYEQRPAFSEDKRIYGALRYDPAFLAKNGMRFSLRMNYEAGDINQSRPRGIPPIDRITPWFNTTPVTIPANPVAGTPERTFAPLNRSVYDLYTAYRNYDPAVPGSGAIGSSLASFVTVNGTKIPNPNYQPGISEIYTDGAAIYFPDPSTTLLQDGIGAIISESTRTAKFGINSRGVIDASVSGIPYARIIGLTEPWKLAQFYGRPFYGNYVSYSLTDPSVFDFYHKLLDGPSKPSTRNFEAFNLDVSETFFNNRAGLSFVYDRQQYRDRLDSLFTDRYQSINVDINATLMNGSPNPNVGRPYITARTNGGGSGLHTSRESLRATAFGEIRATDFMKKSLLSSILGKHVFTGVFSTDDYQRDSRSWSRFLMDQGWPLTTQGINTISSRSFQVYQYIGPDMRSLTSPSGLDLVAPTAMLNPTNASVWYFDSRWKAPVSPTASGYVDPGAVWVDPFNGATRTQSENPANYGGWKTYNAQVLNSLTDGANELTTSGKLERNKLSTKAINWQGYLWDDTVVPLFGYRRDTNKVFTTNAAVAPYGIAQVNNLGTYRLPKEPRAVMTTEIRSWGGVLHMPPFLRGKLPWGTTISLTYNKSNNFNPSDVGRVDMLNNALSPSQGTSKDHGFVITTLDNRINFRAIWFKSTVSGASYGWGAPQGWLFDDEARGWQQANRLKAGLSGDPRFAEDLAYHYYTSVNNVNTITPADIARQERDVANYFADVPWELFAAGGNATPGEATWINGGGNLFVSPNGQKPNGYTATRDTVSKGVEFELSYNVTKSWVISANASKTKASTTNNVGNLVAWLDRRDAFWNGPAGDMLIYHNRTDNAQAANTIRADWNNNVGYPYAFQKYTNGASVQEMPKWKFNLTTNYSFKEGYLKGWKVGGTYSWTAKAALGYKWSYLKMNSTLIEAPDVTQPVYGKSDQTIGLWIGYGRKLTKKVHWDMQLNVRNAFSGDELIPVTVQPDGSYATYRIKEGYNWAITNRFSF